MEDIKSVKLYCKRKNRLCYLADADGNCVSLDYLENEGNMCTADWINWNNVHSSNNNILNGTINK